MNATSPGGRSPERDLLQSVVETARAIFGAQASSIFLLDEASGELVFQAVAGQGEEFLVGTRFPADRGIAGWVVLSGEALIVDDLADDALFARDLAESTRYVPRSLMAAPLTCGESVLGVLEVLDPGPRSQASLPELDLLALFARQAAAALRVVTARPADASPPAAAPVLLDADRRAHGLRLVDALRELLGAG
jgi:GAF domain-containing protein